MNLPFQDIVEDNHVYSLRDGTITDVKSVTTILKALGGFKGEIIAKWRVNTALAKYDAALAGMGTLPDALVREGLIVQAKEQDWTAANEGTLAHAYLAKMLDSNQPDPVPFDGMSPATINLIKANAEKGADWLTDNGYTPIALEQAVIHATGTYAGRIDLILRDKEGGIIVGDAKRAKQIHGAHGVQVAAYSRALVSIGIPVTGGMVLKLPRTLRGKVLAKHVNLGAGLSRFKAALHAFYTEKYENKAIGETIK